MASGQNLQQRESHDMNEALMKNYEKTFMESVAVIHSKFEDAPTTVAFVEVNKNLSDLEKCEFAFKETNTIDKAWWENKSVTPMFDGASSFNQDVRTENVILSVDNPLVSTLINPSDASYCITGVSDMSFSEAIQTSIPQQGTDNRRRAAYMK